MIASKSPPIRNQSSWRWGPRMAAPALRRLERRGKLGLAAGRELALQAALERAVGPAADVGPLGDAGVEQVAPGDRQADVAQIVQPRARRGFGAQRAGERDGLGR